MKINVGIVGYGNLGKAVEKCLVSNPKFNLKAIFSRRLVKSKLGTIIEPYSEFINYKSKVDVMILCSGSKSDLIIQSPEILEHFDIINTFDTHAKIVQEYKKLNIIAKKHNHRAIICCGWDPGLFSIIRALFFAISNKEPITFWGRGLSMGHSDAIRQVANVDDGVQFTIPIKESIEKAKKDTLEKTDFLHKRECYVCAKEKHYKQIEKDIKNIANYFKGQPTKVNFVSQEKVMKLKSNTSHKGFIFSTFKTKSNTKSQMEFKVIMKSNPDFTASIVVAYITAILNLKKQNKSGAFTPLEISPNLLFEDDKFEKLLKTIC